MKKPIKYTIFALAIAGVMALDSCQDQPLMPGEGDRFTSITGEEMDDPFITFDITVPKSTGETGRPLDGINMGTGDYGESWENYIDPAKFRVLFFTGAVRDDADPGEVGSFEDPTEKYINIQGGAGIKNYGNKFLFEVNRNNISIMRHKDDLATGGVGEAEGYRITISSREIFNHDGDIDTWDQPISGENVSEAVKEAIMGQFDEETGKYTGKGNGFKIVVLANWPNTVEDKREYDPVTGDPIMGKSTLPTSDLHLKFGDDLSELSQCVYDNVYGDRYNTVLNKDDGQYYKSNVAYAHFPYDEPSSSDFPLGGRMGVYSVWVKNYFNTFTDVSNFLRDPQGVSGELMTDDNGFQVKFIYDAIPQPDGTYKFSPYSYYRCFDSNESFREENSYTFENVWRVWNFSAGEKTIDAYDNWKNAQGVNGYHTTNPNVADYWEKRNLQEVIKPLKNGEKNVDGLKLGSQATYVEDGGYIKLETTVTGSASYPAEADTDKGIRLTIFGEGTLRIKATAAGNGKLMVCGTTNNKWEREPLFHINDDGSSSTDISVAPGRSLTDNTFMDKDGGYGWEYIVEPNSYPTVDVVIHAHGGTINIYEIEFVRDRHLYDTGRAGIMPSPENPIPLYGCQEFDPIGKYVDNMRANSENSVFNSSDHSANIIEADPYGDYKYKRVYLLRSIAKVELLFKKSVFKDHRPTNMYMRTFNRSARCEPKDVLTPTEVLWYGSAYMDSHASVTNPAHIDYYKKRYPSDKYRGAAQENIDIFNYGALHEENASLKSQPLPVKLPAYYDKTAWFYGAWTEWHSKRLALKGYDNGGWGWNLKEDEGGPVTTRPIDPDAYNNETPKLNYPRVFNTRVDRSDYCRLRYVGDVHLDGEDYMKYVLYIPEKNVDDADSKGDFTQSSKVAHLELRFKDMNENTNMDDEHVYRIYFADYANTKINEIPRDSWDSKEKNNEDDFLDDYCYPIMRNFVYRFKVNSINGGKIGVDFAVCGPEGRSFPSTPVFK